MLNDIPGYFVRGRNGAACPLAPRVPLYWQRGGRKLLTRLSPQTQSVEFCLEFCIFCTLHGKIFSLCIYRMAIHQLTTNYFLSSLAFAKSKTFLMYWWLYIYVLLQSIVYARKGTNIMDTGLLILLSCQLKKITLTSCMHHALWKNGFEILDIQRLDICYSWRL